ncbi:unnamed protein product, partial [marine sediment metagenome]
CRILLERLFDLKNSLRLKEDSFIPNSEIREKIGRNFSIKKQQIKELMDFLEYSGFIELSQSGIKLNFRIEDA